MSVISLTSIPARFDGLGPVLESLLAQGADRVVLTLSRRYLRFDGAVSPPPVPGGVELLWAEDVGPASKLMAAQSAYAGERIVICDDDCLYAPGWLSALENLHDGTNAVAGSVFEVSRLKRKGGLVAQGFAGILLPAGCRIPPVPEPCWFADDLWISACLEKAGIEITPCPAARALVAPHSAPEPLQNETRAETYARAAEEISKRLGLWRRLSTP